MQHTLHIMDWWKWKGDILLPVDEYQNMIRK